MRRGWWVASAAPLWDRPSCTRILACGGSVIDTAKGIAMGALYDGDPWDFFQTGQQPQQALPIGVVLTVPASGSESSSGAVISCTDSNEKVLYGSEKIRPAFCIIDPTLFVTLPPQQTFTGVCDMMSHVLERYFSHEPGCDLTDALCEERSSAAQRTYSGILTT